jgi:hypothetical protein
MKKFTRVTSLIATIVALIAIAVIAAVTLTGCNRQVIDTTWSYNKVIINRQDGSVIEGKLDGWLDFENSDMVQVKIGNTTYYTHSSNVILIHE